MEQIAVAIQNLENAANYSSKFYIFDENGGDIGSDSGVTFRCQDSDGAILARHARIGYEEGFFTISSYENCDIFYADSFSKIASDYETVVNEGDVFRVGSLKLMFINPSKLEEYAAKTQKLIENTPSFDKLDDVRLEPRGKLLNVDFKEQPDINIFPKEDDEFYIKNDSPAKATEPNPAYAPKPFTQNMISSQTLNDLTQKLLSQLRNEIAPNTIESNSATLSVADLEAILSTIRLTDSTKLINSDQLEETLCVSLGHFPIVPTCPSYLVYTEIDRYTYSLVAIYQIIAYDYSEQSHRRLCASFGRPYGSQARRKGW